MSSPDKVVIFEWPRGTRMVRYLDRKAAEEAVLKANGRRSTARILLDQDALLVFEDLETERETRYRTDPTPRYVPRLIMQVETRDPASLLIWGVAVTYDMYLTKELLDAARWVLIEALGLDERHLVGHDRTNHQVRWALHLPYIVQDNAVAALREGPLFPTLQVLLSKFTEETKRLSALVAPTKRNSKRLESYWRDIRKIRSAILVEVSSLVRPVDPGTVTLYQSQLILPVTSLDVHLLLGGDDFADPNLHVWEIQIDPQASSSITLQRWALLDPTYVKPEEDPEVRWINELGRADRLIPHVYRGGDLLDFLEHLDVLVPESHYEHWLDTHIAAPTYHRFEGDDVCIALGLLPFWLRPAEELRQLLEATSSG